MAGFKYSAHMHGEGPAASVALVKPGSRRLTFQPTKSHRLAAMLTNRAIRPQKRLNLGKSNFFIRLVAKVQASQLGGEHDAASDRHLQQASNPDSMFTIPAMIEVFVECVRRGFLNGLDTIRNRLT